MNSNIENIIEPENKFQKYGKIYMIYSDNGPLVYIGSMYHSKYISNRMGSHRCKYRLYLQGKYTYITSFKLFDTYGLENTKVKLVENFSCKTKKELLEREGYWIRYYQNLGNCVNKVISGRNRSDYFKENNYQPQRDYYIRNYDILKEKRKIKYQLEKEKKNI